MDLEEFIKNKLWSTPLLRELYIWNSEKRRFLSEAIKRFSLGERGKGTYSDYLSAFRKHRVTFSEYMFSYEYWNLSEKDRDKFISTSEMQCIYRKLGSHEVRDVFHDKVRFLKTFAPFVHRWWSLARFLTLSQFEDCLSQFDIIAKPIDGTRGDGIVKLRKSEVNDTHELFDSLCRKNYLLEECIEACDELSSFHPASLNTIRVVTISAGERFEVFGALFRMGAHGSVIDNTHSGGVYAPIDPENGIIMMEAIDSQNNHYDKHPDSGKLIKGFQIPQWAQIVETCRRACKVLPDIHFAGWDVCVLPDGDVEIIEGNHAPDFDGGMQAPLKIGVKKRLQESVIRVMGVDPLPYISVWHNR